MRHILACAIIVATTAPAAAQQRPFVFSVTTAEQPRPSVRFDYDVGVGERAFQSDTANQPEQRVGVQASRGRITLLARLGIAEVGSAYQSSQSGEVLYSMFAPARRLALAAGGGMLHEAGGVNVLLARVMAGVNTKSSRLYGNVLFQKPLASDRDAIDLITSVGWARTISPGVSVGVEALGEDLEGFWDRAEAEGGARLLAGPSLHIAPTGRRWQLSAVGGPVFHPSETGRTSDALRDLPPDGRRTSYAFKAALSISLFTQQ